MYVCMYVCMYACMYACMHVCIHLHTYACMYSYVYACMHTFMFAQDKVSIMYTHIQSAYIPGATATTTAQNDRANSICVIETV